MRPLLTADEARALERAAEAGGTSVETLMERAGHAVARVAVRLARGAYGRRAVIVCGKGNNAGDGFVAARYLDAWGMGVAVLLASDGFREPADLNFARLSRTGVRVLPFSDDLADRELGRADVAVDAIFGLGLRGAPTAPYSDLIRAFGRHARIPRVAVDIASGVESDTGAVPGDAVRATVTVAFGAPKIGSFLPPGAYVAGDVEVADIGFPAAAGLEPPRPPVSLLEEADVELPAPRGPEAHKRDAVLLVVAGSRRMAGAPSLVAAGAYRGGAGLVTIAVPEEILPVVQGAVREATFLPLPAGPGGSPSAASWDLIEERLDGFHAVAVGPGLSTDGDTPELVRRIIRESPVPVVGDADAINAFAGRPRDLADRKANLVITPHAGELARLLGRRSDQIGGDPLGSLREAAETIDAAVLLKGWRTLLCDPDGRIRVSTTGTPVLATAGTGDVLTGLIGAFAARKGPEGVPARLDDAAIAAAHVHG
ncbi:MAG: NAD(P)H-hydrate dehydratase, partial [Actinomycetota bacterium]